MPDHLLPADSNSSTFVDVWKILCLQIPYVRAAVQNALLSQDKSFSAILRPPYVDLCQVKIGHNWPKIRHFVENPWTKNGKKKGNLIFALLRCVARLDKIYGAVKIHGRSQTEEMGVFCHSRHRLIGIKALIGSVQVGSVHAELRPDPNSTWTDWSASHFLGLNRVITGFWVN